MLIELKYFTGTGNSLRIMNACKALFEEQGHQVELSSVTTGKPVGQSSDILGFCFPVYAFGIPRVGRHYLENITPFTKKQKVFVLITAGGADEAGFTFEECRKILVKKNCEVIYTEAILMPSNWTVSMNPPTQDEARLIIEKGVKQTGIIVSNILKGVYNQHVFNVPKRYGTFKFYRDYYLFKLLGIHNLWRLFSTYDTCNSCSGCVKVCPTGSITLINHKPQWSSSCEQCMRCVNYCPQQSIFQKYGGDTIGRNRYLEPSFLPLKEARKQ